MEEELMLELFNKYLRIEIIYPGSRRERTNSVIRHISANNEPGFVIYSELNQQNEDAVIDEQITYFEQLKQQFEWKVFDYDQPLDLKEKLRARGFTIEDQEALMVFDLTVGNLLLSIPIKHEVKRITDEKGIWDIITLENEVWGESHQDLGERLVRDLQDVSTELMIYGAYVEGRIVSAAWMYLHEGTPFASLWGGSTLPEYRKRGFYSSLLSIRAQDAAEKGYQLLMVDASSMSEPILAKHGFVCLARSTPCLSPEIK